MTWTWGYRRLAANPNYYNLTATSHRHISDFLSELVEQTLADLTTSKAITVEDESESRSIRLSSDRVLTRLSSRSGHVGAQLGYDQCILPDQYVSLLRPASTCTDVLAVGTVTLDIFSMSLSDKTKLKGLLEIVSSATEFEIVPIRHHEDIYLRKLYDRLPVKLANVDYNSPHFKTNILLQSHFARFVLPADLAADQALVLTKVLK